MIQQTTTPAEAPSRPSWQRGLIARVLWLCPALSLVAAAVLFWLFGFSPWSAVTFALLFGCVISVLWAVIAGMTSGPDWEARK